jgi:diketogulonate reductase-like aldo/keto reductase
MNYKFLGDRTVRLPEIGLGTFNYKRGVEPLRTGLALGASVIDTAEAYGTEEVVGEAIQRNRHRVFLATKVSPVHFRRPDLLLAAEAASDTCGPITSIYISFTGRITLFQLRRRWPRWKSGSGRTECVWG